MPESEINREKHLASSLRCLRFLAAEQQGRRKACCLLQAGQAVHFNSTLSFAIIKNLHIGARGYYLKQLADARVNGVNLPGSREQIGAIGPDMVLNSGKWFSSSMAIAR
jgi:hypothetical protein